MNSDALLFLEFEDIRLDLIKEYDAKGMRASGDFANSLEVFQNDGIIGIKGLMYGQQLETGRRAGGFPPIQAIEQWIVDKGIEVIDISVSSLAFLIARKIAREGWNREGFGGVELISTVITDKRIQNIIDKYGDAKTTEVVSDIIRLTKETLN